MSTDAEDTFVDNGNSFQLSKKQLKVKHQKQRKQVLKQLKEQQAEEYKKLKLHCAEQLMHQLELVKQQKDGKKEHRKWQIEEKQYTKLAKKFEKKKLSQQKEQQQKHLLKVPSLSEKFGKLNVKNQNKLFPTKTPQIPWGNPFQLNYPEVLTLNKRPHYWSDEKTN